MANPTLQDVCRLAGTSDATASMILNGNQAHKFRPETREKVLKAARQLGYVRQQAGQMLRTGRSYHIAILLNHLTNPFFSQYASLLQQELLRRDYTAVSLETHGFTEEEDDLLRWLAERNIDGVINLQPFITSDRETYEQFAARAPLVIRTGADRPAGDPVDTIAIDYRHGLEELAGHMSAMGCRRPGVLAVPHHMPGQADGHDAPWTEQCRQAFAAAGIPIAEDHWFDAGPESELADWYEAARRLARSRLPIDGLVAHNALVMPPVVAGLQEAGVTIGRDLAVATFDDPPELRYLAGGITTVYEPMEKIAGRLVEILLDRIADPQQPTTLQVEQPQLVIRGSTGDLKAAGGS
ncbi:MAG: LacI family DNA-binding transcriptional regulator [Phycisphaeraceae bacterium]|nr:LacI family DNA-binding transcriptional regulator [Phycisphaeraceae bacterium]